MPTLWYILYTGGLPHNRKRRRVHNDDDRMTTTDRTAQPTRDNETVRAVELWYAPLPRPLTPFAWHHYFVVRFPDHADRYEVWQRKKAGGESVGHIHRNLMRPESGVGGGPAVCACRWEGDDARRIAAVLADTFSRYPHRDRYLVFPGPNSNTFVAWVLRAANVAYSFNWRAFGVFFP